MGWEFDGGEDEFNSFCNQNSNDEIYNYYDSGEQWVSSIFFNELNRSFVSFFL